MIATLMRFLVYEPKVLQSQKSFLIVQAVCIWQSNLPWTILQQKLTKLTF